MGRVVSFAKEAVLTVVIGAGLLLAIYVLETFVPQPFWAGMFG